MLIRNIIRKPMANIVSSIARAGGSMWSPARLGLNVRERTLEGGLAYESSLLSNLPVLRSLEPYGTYRASRQGRCWLLDGINDYGVYSGAHGIGAANATLCCRVKIAGATKGAFLNLQNGFAIGIGNGLFESSGSQLLVLYAGLRWIPTGFFMVAGTEYHVALVVNASGHPSVYVNGSLVYSDTSGSPNSPVNLVYVGNEVSGSRFYGGRLWDARFYNVAKSLSEIQAIYAGDYEDPDRTGLVAGYWCNEESGTLGYDWSGNGRHLTLTNITQSTFHATDTGVTRNANNVHGQRFANNLLTYSEDFTTSWAPLSGTYGVVTANSTTNPVNGEATADTFTAGSSGLDIRKTASGLTSGQTYTFSCYLKAGTCTFGEVHFYDTTDRRALFDLTNGAVSLPDPGVDGRIENAGNGWYRCSVTVTINATTAYPILRGHATGSYASNATNGTTLYAWGAQLAIGSEASNYTKTVATTFPAVYIPADLSSPGNAADGNALTHTGQAPYPVATESVCLTTPDALGGGVRAASASNIGISGAGTRTIVFWAKADATSSNRCFASFGSESPGLLFAPAIRSGNYNFSDWSGEWNTGVAADTNWHHHAITYNGTRLEWFIDGVSIGTNTRSLNTTNSPFTILARQRTSVDEEFAGRMSDVRLYNVAKNAAQVQNIMNGGSDTTGLVGHWPLQDGPGSANLNRTCLDASGNGNHLTLVNGTVSTIWANRCPRVRDWCIEHGGRLGTNGEFILGIPDSNLCADGNTKTLTAGKHGNPYSRLLLNAFSAAELNGRSIPASLAPGGSLAGVTPSDSAFIRSAADGDDRLLITKAALTGSNLAKAQAWVQ